MPLLKTHSKKSKERRSKHFLMVHWDWLCIGLFNNWTWFKFDAHENRRTRLARLGISMTDILNYGRLRMCMWWLQSRRLTTDVEITQVWYRWQEVERFQQSIAFAVHVGMSERDLTTGGVVPNHILEGYESLVVAPEGLQWSLGSRQIHNFNIFVVVAWNKLYFCSNSRQLWN